MNYQEALSWLDAAETMQARSITVELDEGTFDFTLEEASEVWEDLSPGMPFQIISINI